MDGNTYWRHPFNSLCNPRQLEEFIVMDMDIIRDQKLGAGAGVRSNKVSLGGQTRFLVGSTLYYTTTCTIGVCLLWLVFGFHLNLTLVLIYLNK